MTKEVYLDILKNELIVSVEKFGFIDPFNLNKLYYKYYQDNDSKHFIYVSPNYYTTVQKLLILKPKVLIKILSKICGFI